MSAHRMILRLAVCAALAAAAAMPASADRASRTPFLYVQPDGSTIEMVRHGDEFYSWTTDPRGGTLVKDADGFYRPGTPDPGSRSRAILRAHAERAVREGELETIARAPAPFGEKKFLVVLVQWKDLKFKSSTAQTDFRALLNNPGYSVNGAVGSARDYFIDNSLGQFSPTFDVLGPVTVDFNHDDFPEGDSDHHYSLARKTFISAIDMIDSQVDFRKYDLDNDGQVDNVFFYYAGEAQSNGGGDDTIWPHASSLSAGVHDGVRPGRYACASELIAYSENGTRKTRMTGIGTMCHEFGHVIGLPDLYDTDYEKNGQAIHPDDLALMSGGNHNQGGCVPPYMIGIEREMLGWVEIPEWEGPGAKVLHSLATGDCAYLPANLEGECFLFEVRDGTKWDYPLPKGVVIYHMDSSRRPITGGTPLQLWNNRTINIYADHPCFYPVMTSGTAFSLPNAVWPGDSGKTLFFPQDWDGAYVDWVLRDIAYYGGDSATMTLCMDGFVLTGRVLDSTGNGVSGAQICASPFSGVKTFSTSAGEGPALRIPPSIADGAYARTESFKDGSFTLFMDKEEAEKFEFVAFKDGYIEQYKVVSFADLPVRVEDFVVSKVVTQAGGDIIAFPGSFGYNNAFGLATDMPYTISAATRYAPEMLAPFAGLTLTSVTIYVPEGDVDALYVLVESEGERLATVPVKDYSPGPRTVDVGGRGVRIPDGGSLVLGVSFVRSNIQYPIHGRAQVNGSATLYSGTFSEKPFGWASYSGFNLYISGTVENKFELGYEMLGSGYIDLAGASLRSGNTLDLVLRNPTGEPSSVEWWWDGSRLESTSVQLTYGLHEIKALASYPDGRVEHVRAMVDVK